MTPSAAIIIEVALPLPVDRTFHYLVPGSLTGRAQPGTRVLVPFGSRKLIGYVLTYVQGSEVDRLKEVIDALDDTPLWTDRELELFRWIAGYYLHPLGEVLKTALPAGINPRMGKGVDGNVSGAGKIRHETVYVPGNSNDPRKSLGPKAAEILRVIRGEGEVSSIVLGKRFASCSVQLKRLTELGLVEKRERELFRDPFRNETVERDPPRQLNPHQREVMDALISRLNSRRYSPCLLHGVTGSGKTEVYLQVIARALEKGLNALILVPEISLTPQLVHRFRARFEDGIAILHSGLSDGERYDEWRRIRRGLARIVIGARSAVFAPLENIGVIVVDEEHETSFKQNDGLRYNGRDLALVRGKMENALVILGSATPLVTSLYAAERGKLELLSLPERVRGAPMPKVETVAMQGIKSTISPRLRQTLEETMAEGGQAIIFLNRRGFATYLVCGECGKPLTCPNCSVTLTYHRGRGQSVCHYCDYTVPAPGICPACGCPELKEFGAGTERVEHELSELLPEARLLRMDGDTTTGKGSHARLLGRMAQGTADILIGTQMITKGHDFPGVTLVGVINGEASLHIPDFRSAERTFQLLSQVFGRAGRGEAPGRVILQVLNPDHYAVQCAICHDYRSFYRQELEFRNEAGYPPFTHLAILGFSGTAEQAVEERAGFSADTLARLRRELALRVEILGPAPAPIYRLRGRFRRRILLKSPSRSDLRRLVTAWLDRREKAANVRQTIDIDPVDMS